MFAVTPGPFAVLDADGNALCHGTRQTRGNLNSARRRKAVDEWHAALTGAGLMRGTMVLCSDNVWRDRGAGIDSRDGYADLGHIIADSHDGAFCGCNAVPVEGEANRTNGDARQAIEWDAATRDAYAASFRAVALASMTKTKRARAV